MNVGLAGQKGDGIRSGASGLIAELDSTDIVFLRFCAVLGSPNPSPGPDGGGSESSSSSIRSKEA